MKSVNTSSGRDVDSVALDPDQRDFSGNIGGLQMTTSSRKSSNADLNKIDETGGNITVEGGYLSVNGRNLKRQTDTHHTSTLILILQFLQPSVPQLELYTQKQVTWFLFLGTVTKQTSVGNEFFKAA